MFVWDICFLNRVRMGYGYFKTLLICFFLSLRSIFGLQRAVRGISGVLVVKFCSKTLLGKNNFLSRRVSLKFELLIAEMNKRDETAKGSL